MNIAGTACFHLRTETGMKPVTVMKPTNAHKCTKEYYIINLLHVSVILVAIQREVYYKGWLLSSTLCNTSRVPETCKRNT